MSSNSSGVQRFDWGAAKERLESSAHVQERSNEDVFARRALELARMPDAAEGRGSLHLVFEVSGERFAVALDAVRVILQADALHAVPFARASVDRVLLVQGKFVSVYDVGLRARGSRSTGQVVIVLVGDEQVGLRADEVHGLTSIDHSTLIKPRDEGGSLDPILRGTSSDHVRVVDVARLFSDCLH